MFRESERHNFTIDNMCSESLYFQELSQLNRLSESEEQRLLKAVKDGDDKAKEILANSNLRLVVSVAKKFTRSGVPIMDLIQDGNMGLLNAIRKFDTKHGTRFSTYAVWHIRHYIMRAIANKSRLIRIPVNLIEKKNRIEKVISEARKKEGYEPSISELARSTNLPKKLVTKILDYFQPVQPIDLQNYSNSEKATWSFFGGIENDAGRPDTEILKKTARNELRCKMDALDIREKQILFLYFGIDGQRSYTLKELGLRFNLTRERIRQIKNAAIDKMRCSMLESAA
jgi:RNA polymerase primary sigma factor